MRYRFRTTPSGGGSNGLLTSLVAYYKMDAASGNETDSTANAKTLTASNNPSSTTGKLNSCRGSDGVANRYFTRSDSAFNPLSNPFCVSVWLRLNSTPSNFPGVIGVQDTGLNQRAWCLLIDTSGKPYIEVSTNGSTAAANATWGSALSTGTFHHILAGWTGTNLWISVNAGTAVTTAFSSTLFNSSAALSVLARLNSGSGTANVNGDLDEVGYWSKAPTSQMATSLYNGGSALAYTSFS